jgi:hypothetical protein
MTDHLADRLSRAQLAATLPDGATLPFNFLISGTGETMTEDSTSGVQSWANAPAVPTAPV